MSRDRLAKLKTEVFEQAGFINKKHNITTFMHKVEYFTCSQRSVNPFISKR